jgi:hypothetical protein
MTRKLLADAVPWAEHERPYIAQALLESFIGNWLEFQKRAIKIFDDNNFDLVMGSWEDAKTASKQDKRAARYVRQIEQLAEDMGLRATWGARETHEIIHGAAWRRHIHKKEEWRPLGGLGSVGEPDGFLIEIKHYVDYPLTWNAVSKSILAKAREQYEAGREANKWGNPRRRKSSPTLSRNVRWLFERITLGKSYEQIAREAQLDDLTQHKRSAETKEHESVTIDDVKKAVSSMAMILKITLP